MRAASASWLTSPSTENALPPALAISSTRLSTPPQLVSVSPGALNSLAIPAGRTSETTTVRPLAANARAVELPMPIALPQPVMRATRSDWGMGEPPFATLWPLSRLREREGPAPKAWEGEDQWATATLTRLAMRGTLSRLRERG